MEPKEVQVKTSEYRDDNNIFDQWFDDKLQENITGVLQFKELVSIFYQEERKVTKKMKDKIRSAIINYIKLKYPLIDSQYQDSTFSGVKYRGWKQISFREKHRLSVNPEKPKLENH